MLWPGRVVLLLGLLIPAAVPTVVLADDPPADVSTAPVAPPTSDSPPADATEAAPEDPPGQVVTINIPGGVPKVAKQKPAPVDKPAAPRTTRATSAPPVSAARPRRPPQPTRTVIARSRTPASPVRVAAIHGGRSVRVDVVAPRARGGQSAAAVVVATPRSANLAAVPTVSQARRLPAWFVGIVAMALVADAFLLARFARQRWAQRIRRGGERLASDFD